jgi:hypothetical protein
MKMKVTKKLFALAVITALLFLSARRCFSLDTQGKNPDGTFLLYLKPVSDIDADKH